jgi:hypothetical protein
MTDVHCINALGSMPEHALDSPDMTRNCRARRRTWLG